MNTDLTPHWDELKLRRRDFLFQMAAGALALTGCTISPIPAPPQPPQPPQPQPNMLWGTGTDVGTLTADLWTPGRDAEGRVNQVSFEGLEPNRMYEIANSRLDGLNPRVKAEMLALTGQPWVDRGVSQWNGVTDAWVGMCWDLRMGSERGWIGPGGGHAASTNNGLYRFDVRKMRWDIERLPSPSYIWPQGYQGDSYYPPAVAYSKANPSSGVWYDEVFDGEYPNDPHRSSRMPTPRHTYQSTVFVPTDGPQGSIYMACRRAWKYDLASKTWSVPRAYFNNPDPQTFSSAENMICWWDEVRKRFYHCGNNASIDGSTRNFWWDGDTGFGTDGFYPSEGWETTSSCFEQRGRVLWQLIYAPNNENPQRPGNPNEMRRLDLNTGQIQSYPISMGGSWAGLTFGTAEQAQYWDTSGMTFVEAINKWLCNVYTQEQQELWAWIDPTTWVCERATDIQGAVAKVYNLEGKVKYVPSIKAMIHFTSADVNHRVMRFA